MPWGRCDDKWWDHAKVLEMRASLLLPAGGLYWRAISWSNAKLADGRVSAAVVRLLGGNQRHADELVRVTLWEGSWENGYLVHDYLDFNKSRRQVMAERAKWAEDKARQRGMSSTESTAESDRESTVESGPESTADSRPETPNVHGGVLSRAGGGHARRSRPVSPVSPVESLLEEDPSSRMRATRDARRARGENGTAHERADVQALLDHGWRRVTAAQRRVLDEVLHRHDVTGPRWAAEIIGATAPIADPLQAVIAADRAWQAEQADADDRRLAEWDATKAAERADAERALGGIAEVLG